MNIFGERLKALRLQKGLSQAETANRLGLKDGRSIRQYEGGENEPTLSRLILIAKLFHVSIDYLAGTTDEVMSKDQFTLLNAFDNLSDEKQQDAIKLLMALQ